MKVLHVVGARPNFMKATPVYRALQQAGHSQELVHTGQHYDRNLSDVFFTELGIPDPDHNLNVGSHSHAQQTAKIMSHFEPVVLHVNPDIVLVYGDVNSTVAAALVCAKLGIMIGHVEAGLRSFDRTMPEEVNRVITDQLADLLFTPSIDGNENLQREGIPPDRVSLVGNVMIDTLVRFLPALDEIYHRLQPALPLDGFGLVTLHRPSNVDQSSTFLPILHTLSSLSRRLPLVFPVHPRTWNRWQDHLNRCDSNLHIIDPVGYLEFLALQKHARIVLTDSGGIQEETTYLGVPCLTLRENTERPITISMGTNVLVGQDCGSLEYHFNKALTNGNNMRRVPPLWDGRAAERIVTVLEQKVPCAVNVH